MSANHRFIKFWPQDWQRDPALRMCSLAARGLWIDMLCIMHEGTPYGHLTINDRPVTTKQIGAITSVGEKEAARLIEELEEAGVFSRTADGTIFSRRMVRDNEKAEEGRKHVKRRWSNGHDEEPSSDPSTEPSSWPSSPPIRSPGSLARTTPRTQESRSKNQEKSTLLRSGTAGTAVPAKARDIIWSEGLSNLRDLTGVSDRAGRAMLGRWLRSLRDDAAVLAAILAEAADRRPVDPNAWISAAVQSRAGPRSTLDDMAERWDLPTLDELDAYAAGTTGTTRRLQ